MAYRGAFSVAVRPIAHLTLRSRLPVMMYFSRLKTGLILGVCLLGALLCIPNLMPAPVSWLPWRTVHLGLDLRGGSYLLLEVDMAAVVKERLDSLTDGVRQVLRPGNIFYQTLRAEPASNRVLLRLRDVTRLNEAVAALQPLVSPTGRSGAPDIDIVATPDGQITLTLNPVGLTDRASAAVQQSIEIIRRRIDTGLDGVGLFFFAEGTRSTTEELLPFKKGAAIAALETGLDCVPIGVAGAQQVQAPKGFSLLRPGPIAVVFGAPLSLAGHTLENRDALVAAQRAAVEKVIAEARALVAGAS